MQIPLEVNYRDVEKTDSLEAIIRRHVDKLHRFARDIVRCRLAVERPQAHQRGIPYRVRIEVTLPRDHDLVVVKNPGDSGPHEGLRTVLANAFRAMERRLKKTVAIRRGETRTAPAPTDASRPRSLRAGGGPVDGLPD
jgi:hypothetical protein